MHSHPFGVSRRVALRGIAASLALAASASIDAQEVLGTWQSEATGGLRIRIAAERCTLVDGDKRTFAFAELGDGVARVWVPGRPEHWRFRIDEDRLQLDRGDGERPYVRAEDLGDVEPKPFALGEQPLTDEQIASLRLELTDRGAKDQQARQHEVESMAAGEQPDAEQVAERERIDTENTARLRELLRDHGWISSEVVGDKAAGAAFLIVQHSGDLPLMLAALPAIREELEAGSIEAQSYSLLFDRLQMHLGRRQRFGTQLTTDSDGSLVLHPLEDADGVEERRKEIGLFPLAMYLQLIEKAYGKPVKRDG